MVLKMKEGRPKNRDDRVTQVLKREATQCVASREFVFS